MEDLKGIPRSQIRLNNIGSGEMPYGPIGNIEGVTPNVSKAVKRWRILDEADGDKR